MRSSSTSKTAGNDQERGVPYSTRLRRLCGTTDTVNKEATRITRLQSRELRKRLRTMTVRPFQGRTGQKRALPKSRSRNSNPPSKRANRSRSDVTQKTSKTNEVAGSSPSGVSSNAKVRGENHATANETHEDITSTRRSVPGPTENEMLHGGGNTISPTPTTLARTRGAGSSCQNLPADPQRGRAVSSNPTPIISQNGTSPSSNPTQTVAPPRPQVSSTSAQAGPPTRRAVQQALPEAVDALRNPRNSSNIPEGRMSDLELDEHSEGVQTRSGSQRTSGSVELNSVPRLLIESERRVMKYLVSQQRVFLTRIAAVEDAVNDLPSSIGNLKREILDIKKMILPITNTNGKQRSTTRNPVSRARNKTRISTLQEEVVSSNPTLIAELNIVFTPDASCMATAKAITYQIEKFQSKKELVSKTSRMMSAMLFGLKKNMQKAAWKEGLGLKHAELRFRVMKFMLQRAKSLPEDVFTSDNADLDTGITTERVLHGGKSSWLTTDAVTSRDLQLARMQQECRSLEHPDDPTDPEKRQSLFIAKSVMKVVIDMLRQSREKSRVRLFEEGVVCLLNWEGFEWFPRDLSNPILAFVWPEEAVIPPSSIPECAEGVVDNVREVNRDILQKFITERKEMLVEAKYDVHIKTAVASNGRHTRGGNEKRRLRRVINVLRMSSSFLTSFFHLTEDELLSSDSTMLRTIYRFALVIRRLFVKKIENGFQFDNAMQIATVNRRASENDNGREELGPHMNSQREGYAQTAARLSTSGTPAISVVGLLPSESEVLRLLLNAVNLSLDTFDKMNVLIEGDTEIAEEHTTVNGNGKETRRDNGLSDSESEDEGLYDMCTDDDE